MKRNGILIFSSVIFLTLIFSFASKSLSQEGRGFTVKVKKPNGQTDDVQLYEGSYALVIGNSEYLNGWNRLSGVKSDVVAVRSVLERQGLSLILIVSVCCCRLFAERE